MTTPHKTPGKQGIRIIQTGGASEANAHRGKYWQYCEDSAKGCAWWLENRHFVLDYTPNAEIEREGISFKYLREVVLKYSIAFKIQSSLFELRTASKADVRIKPEEYV